VLALECLCGSAYSIPNVLENERFCRQTKKSTKIGGEGFDLPAHGGDPRGRRLRGRGPVFHGAARFDGTEYDGQK